jgi:hypothetical protein
MEQFQQKCVAVLPGKARSAFTGNCVNKKIEVRSASRESSPLSPAYQARQAREACGLPRLPLPNFDRQRQGSQPDAEFKVKDRT